MEYRPSPTRPVADANGFSFPATGTAETPRLVRLCDLIVKQSAEIGNLTLALNNIREKLGAVPRPMASVGASGLEPKASREGQIGALEDAADALAYHVQGLSEEIDRLRETL